MPLSKTIPLLSALLTFSACVADEGGASLDFELSAGPTAGVLAFVNDTQATDMQRLDVDCAIRSDSAKHILRHRDGADRVAGTADDDLFDDLDELDAVKMVGPWTMQRLTNCAWLYGYMRGAGPTLSASGTADVDGVLSPGEWANAQSMDVLVRYSSRVTIPARLHVMNDSVRLYMAVEIDEDISDRMLRFTVLFDNNGDGLADPGEDRITAVWSPSSRTTRFGDAHVLARYQRAGDHVASSVYDSAYGGTSDGGAATGVRNGATVIEMWHPLRSGDAHDLSVSAGAVVPFSWGVGVLQDEWIETREWANFGASSDDNGSPTDVPWSLPDSVLADLAAIADGYREESVAEPMILAEQTADLVGGVPVAYHVKYVQWIDREGGIQLWVEFDLDAAYNITREDAYI